MIKRKYIVLLMVTLVSIPLAGLLYSNLVQAQTTVTGYVSVSWAAFVPSNSTEKTWIVYGLFNFDATVVYFYGSVQLPHGATVTKVTSRWHDMGTGTILCYLVKDNVTDHVQMADVSSYGAAGDGSTKDTTIDDATIDNSNSWYILDVWVPPSASHFDYCFYGVIIEYTLPSGAVGGLYIPVDKFSLLAPYIALTLTMILAIAVSGAFLKYRKKQ